MKTLQFNIRAIYLSLHSRIFYWDIIRNRRSSGASYIILLAVILAVIYASIFAKGAVVVKDQLLSQIAIVSPEGDITGLRPKAQEVVNSMPKMTIVGNQIQFDITEAKVIESPDMYLPVVFDPTGKFNAGKLERVVILNANHLILKLFDNQQVIKVQDLIQLEFFKQFSTTDGVIDNTKMAIHLLDVFLGFSSLVTPIMFIYGFLANMVIMGVSWIFFAMITTFMFNVLKVQNNDFKNALRIAAYTATPVFLLDAVQLLLMKQLFGLQFLVYFTLHILYIYSAIDAYRNIELSKINKIV